MLAAEIYSNCMSSHVRACDNEEKHYFDYLQSGYDGKCMCAYI